MKQFIAMLFLANILSITIYAVYNINGVPIQLGKNKGISGLDVAQDGCIFLTMNPGMVLFRDQSNNNWIVQEKFPSSTAIAIKNHEEKIYLGFIERIIINDKYRYNLCYKTWDGKWSELNKFERCMLRPQSYLSLDANKTQICFAWEEKIQYGINFFDMFCFERNKVITALYDKRSNRFKVIKLTPESKTMKYMEGWEPIIVGFDDCFNIFCKEKYIDKEDLYDPCLGIKLIKYDLEPDGKAKRIELYEGIKYFDAIKHNEDEVFLVVGTIEEGIKTRSGHIEGGRIKLIILNRNNQKEVIDIGFGEKPKIIRTISGQYHIFWIRTDDNWTKLIQRVYNNGNISEERIIVNDIGSSKYDNINYLFKTGDTFKAVAKPDGCILIIWEDQGEFFEKTLATTL